MAQVAQACAGRGADVRAGSVEGARMGRGAGHFEERNHQVLRRGAKSPRAYKSLFELRDDQEGVESVGIGAKDWRVIKELWDRGVRFDWTMFACAPTLLVHPPELLDFVKRLKDAGVTLIDSAVFNGGFLMGSNMLDYREADPERDAAAFAFRDRYLALCREWGLDPAAAAVEYAFRLGFDAVALNTSNPKRVVQNARYGDHRSPEEFWRCI